MSSSDGTPNTARRPAKRRPAHTLHARPARRRAPLTVDSEAVFQLFLETLDVAPPARDGFLKTRCKGDDALEAEVRCLLALHAASSQGDDAANVDAPDPGGTRHFETLEFDDWSPDQILSAGSEGASQGPRYRPDGPLGRGGFGQVDRWFDRALRRSVAAKRPHRTTRAAQARLLHEARLLAYLDHPGVVAVHDLETIDGQTVCIMRRLEGQTLEERLADCAERGERLPISESLRLLTRVLETIANAHAKGVVHLDLKPANIVLEGFGQTAVIDWGIARFFDLTRYEAHLADLGETTALSGTSVTGSAGTPAYMPPEQFVDGELGPAADIYALGTLMFEMLTGQLPFDPGKSLLGLAVRKKRGPPALRPLRPDVSETLEDICLRMLAPEPADRPASLDVVLAELAALSDFMSSKRVRVLKPGERLITQGEVGREAYQVIEGELAVVMDDDRIIRKQGPGDIVGELALISNKPRSATVYATCRAVVRVMDWAALTDELKKVNPVIGQLLRSLSDKLIEWR